MCQTRSPLRSLERPPEDHRDHPSYIKHSDNEASFEIREAHRLHDLRQPELGSEESDRGGHTG